ncbi:TIGR03087 family PEP-CTERM/XrtA system glycosyltransferase [Motilimonas cestriensis]|uniref:TIGR03087 family PEP-CTERM/XrtA system glycosyltransferase n=1 Tax=Motilimonas cestriensis TaxID=2742685 RepID=UPI003DA57C85
MEKILFLCHRVPYPPNKGDKIRSYHWLQYLKQRYQVLLGAFIDDPDDWQYQGIIAEDLADCCLVKRHPLWHKVASLRAMLDGRPLSLAYYQSQQMRAWVEQVIKECPGIKVLTFSSVMAQYVDDANQFRVMDFVDIDSDKWLQYANQASGIMSWLYRREFNALARYEAQVASAFNLSLFVSKNEADDFQNRQSSSAQQEVNWVQNGVDIQYFDPAVVDVSSPFKQGEPVVVFTGAMDYWANVEGVVWFVQHVWPGVLAHQPEAKFYIVGSNPSKSILKLAQLPGIVVTGKVPDVRPYLKYARLVVAPLRISRGIQNKVLEALAMDKKVVGSSHAFTGIGLMPCTYVADNEEEFLNHCIEHLDSSGEVQARRWIEDNFSWQTSFARLDKLIFQAGG